MEFGVHVSLPSGVHFSLPPLYERTVCSFSQVIYDHIERGINFFDRESALTELDVNEQVSVFNNTITNMMSHFVPDEIIICINRDNPWMKCHIKNLIPYKDNFYKNVYTRKEQYVQGRIQD